MRRNFSLTIEDYAKFRRSIQKKNSKSSQLVPLVMLILVVVSCILWLNTFEKDDSFLNIVAAALVIVSTFYIYRRYMSHKLKECEKQAFAKTTLGDPVEMYHDDKKLVIQRKSHQSIWQWSAFSDVTNEGDSVYLWFSELEALIIPQQAFTDDREMEEFLTECKFRLAKNET